MFITRYAAYIVMAYVVMACIVMAYVVMVYIVVACIVTAYIVMAYIVLAPPNPSPRTCIDVCPYTHLCEAMAVCMCRCMSVRMFIARYAPKPATHIMACIVMACIVMA